MVSHADLLKRLVAILSFLAALSIVAAQVGHATVTSAQNAARVHDFERNLRSATGPEELRVLEAWCRKEGLDAEQKRVAEILGNIRLPKRLSGEARRRAKARHIRAEARKNVAEFMSAQRDAVLAALAKIISWMKENRYAPQATRQRISSTIRELTHGSPGGSPLYGALSAVVHDRRTPEEDAALAKQLDAQTRKAMSTFTGQLFAAIDRCLRAREAGLAFDLYQFLLRVDPGNDRAHRSIGEVPLGDVWLRPYAVLQHKRGLAWDDRLGWTLERGRAQYAQGQYFDLQTRRWLALADLNRVRADIKQAWKLESEHFELTSTADLEVSVQVLARLEAFFLQAFRQYDGFFSGRSARQSAKLVFGVLPMKKRLKVFFYRDRDQFTREARPPVEWAGGFYDSGRRASFFYAEGGSFDVSILQHELTHQILGEFSSGHGPVWIAEGAAVFLENSYFNGPTLTTGSPTRNYRIQQYASGVRGGMEHTLADIVRFKTLDDWKIGAIRKNYRGVGALITFLMHFDGGRYRADTVDMIREAYSGNLRPLSDYFGMSLDSLQFLMKRFYTDCDLSRMDGTVLGPR